VKASPAAAAGGNGAARAAGFTALEAGNVVSAERNFARAVSQNRQDADALGGLGLVRLRQERFVEARDLLERASHLGTASKWSSALASARYFGGLAEARLALGQGRLAEAQTQAEALVRSDYSDRAPALELLAQVYEKQGRFADAADIYRQAGEGGGVASTRLQSRAARDRALQAAAAGNYAVADQEFVSGLMLDQKDPWIRYEYARYLIARGRVAEVDTLVGSFASSTDPDWLYAGALVNAEMGRKGTADALINRIPENQQTQQMRGFSLGLKVDWAIERTKALAGEGRQGEALAALRQLAASPGLPTARLGSIADALYELGDTSGAAMLAQQALSGNIEDPAAYESIVRVLAKSGNDALAANAAQRAAQLAGPSPDGQRIVGRMNGVLAASQADRLRLAGQFATAFDTLQGAWNAAPGDTEVLAALARLYQSGGMAAQAAQSFQLVLRQKPQDKGALMGLIETAGAAGDRQLARETVERALSVAPDDYEILLSAARMEQARGDEGAAVKYLKRARQAYAAATRSASVSATNPFAVAPSGNNPFRNQAAMQQPQVNPFALNKGARLDGAPAQAFPEAFPQGYAQGGGAAYPAQMQPQMPGQMQPQMQAPMQTPMAANGGGWAAPGMGYNGVPDSVSVTGEVIADPVLRRIQSDLATLTQESGPRADFKTGFRSRKGETGLSALKEVTGAAEISTGFAGGRIAARAEAVVLDSGRPTGSPAARFGRNATPEAQGIVDEEPSKLTQVGTQHASGIAPAMAYEGDFVQAEVGTTPLGFGSSQITWRGAISPRFSAYSTAKVWFERKPVTDSVLSYAGTVDPVSGQPWGQVMRTGGGASFSYDRDGSGIYGDGAYSRYRGENVPNNHGFQLNVGGYTPLYRTEGSNLVGGVNLNYQSFSQNQNFFTYGHGGYFSPQSFFSVSFPVRYSMTTPTLELHAGIAPGYQSYEQDQVGIYPTDSAAQAVLDSLKAQNSDVRSYYDSISKTGFALSADGSAYYRLSPRTRVGGEVSYNSFGSYDELKSSIGIRQSLGGGK
jgi:Flp pilus assembly protein TadD